MACCSLTRSVNRYAAAVCLFEQRFVFYCVCLCGSQVEAEGEVLGLFCGKEDTDTEVVPAQQVISSPRNSLSVQFCSDFSNEERFSGFMAHYSAVGEQPSQHRPHRRNTHDGKYSVEHISDRRAAVLQLNC